KSRLRNLLLQYFKGRHAHITFEQAVEDIPFDQTGIRPEGLPHSCWELVKHIQLAQRDIIEFCRNADYETPGWPDDYWPAEPKPASKEEWRETLSAIEQDREMVASLVKDSDADFLAQIPHGSGQTLFREVLLIIDHNAYHIGQIVQIRRLLRIWNK